MAWHHFFQRRKRLSAHREELQFYLDAETDDNVARGMPREEACFAARRKLGNLSLIREDVYRMNTIGLAESAWNDLRYSLRTMRKSLGFTLTAVITLALGIGGNTAMFTLVRAVLLQPLAFRDPDKLVYLAVDHPRDGLFDRQFPLSGLDQMRHALGSVDLGAFGANLESMTLSGRGEPEALNGARVSANFLTILGVQPLLGRSFLEQEDMPNAPPVVMISAGLWKRRFHHDPSIVGKAVTLDSRAYTIAGVLPPGFEFPFAGLDVWFPKPSEWSALPPRYWYLSLVYGFGRLGPDVSLEQARAAIAVLDRHYPQSYSGPDPGELRVLRLKDRLVDNARPMLWMLFGAVGFVLLIACANVANLLLARSAARSREFAIRTALGAARARLVRQLFVESLTLALAGGLLGALFGKVVLIVVNAETLNLYSPNALYLPGAGKIALDGTVLAFTLALCFVSAMLFGLFPSFQLSRPALTEDLRETGPAAGRSAPGHRVRFRLPTRAVMVVAQIAMCIVLLIGAALLMRSVARLGNVDPGFDSAHLLTMKIALPPARYDTGPKRAAFITDLVQHIEMMPGIRSAAAAMSLPTTIWIRTNITQIEGRPAPDERDPLLAVIQSITPGYFEALRIPLRRGREFTMRDNSPGAPPTVIVNETLARRLWPNYPNGANPIGRHISEGFDKKAGWLQIVGIAADIREGGLASKLVPEFYVPCAVHPAQSAYLVIRTPGDPLNLTNAVRNEVHTIDPDQSVSQVKTMEDVLEASLGQRRTTMLLLELFAGTALLLATTGIYGTVAYTVSQRTQELGIRRALGAQTPQILRPVLAQALGLSFVGIATGIVGALAVTRVVKNLLFDVSPTDPAAFAAASLLFLLVALVASYLPAKRATKIDPVTALRVG